MRATGLGEAAEDAVLNLFEQLGVSLIGTPLCAGDVYTGLLLPRFGAPSCCHCRCTALANCQPQLVSKDP
jgi:hypothetical protein